MKYEVIKACIIKGKSCRVGEIVDLEGDVVKGLMGIGRIAPHDESKIENRSVGLENSEDKPKRRTRKPKVEEVKEEVEDSTEEE